MAGTESFRDKLRAAAARYVPGPGCGNVVFFEADSQPLGRESGARFGWAELAGSGWKVITVPGKHVTMLDPGLVDSLARELESCLRDSPCGALLQHSITQ